MKLKIAILIFGLVGFSEAAGYQPQNFGYVNISVSSMTASAISSLTPQGVGNLVVCTNCGAFNFGTSGLCMSTGTTVGSFIAISSATAVSVCK